MEHSDGRVQNCKEKGSEAVPGCHKRTEVPKSIHHNAGSTSRYMRDLASFKPPEDDIDLQMQRDSARSPEARQLHYHGSTSPGDCDDGFPFDKSKVSSQQQNEILTPPWGVSHLSHCHHGDGESPSASGDFIPSVRRKYLPVVQLLPGSVKTVSAGVDNPAFIPPTESSRELDEEHPWKHAREKNSCSVDESGLLCG